jgi:hypothetical protein
VAAYAAEALRAGQRRPVRGLPAHEIGEPVGVWWDHLQHLDDRPVGSCHLEAALALPSESDAELVEGLAGCEVTSVDLERIAQGPVHAVGLGASHPYRSIATAPLAFGSDLGRATNTNPRRLQLPEYIEPIARTSSSMTTSSTITFSPERAAAAVAWWYACNKRRQVAPIFS